MKPTRLTYGLLAAGLALAWLPAPAESQSFLGKPMQQWLGDLGSKSPPQRRSAAFALGKMGKDAKDALGELAGRLKDDDAGVREAAAFAIGEICLAASVWHKDSLPALCEKLKDEKEDPMVRRSAAYALGCMRKFDSDEVRAALTAGLKSPSPAVKQNVAWALGRMGDASVPDLRQALKDADTLVRRDAAKALEQLSPTAAAAAVAELVECCKDKDLELRKAAVVTMVRLARPEVKDAALVPMLALLKDPSPEIRQNAALAVGHIGGPEAIAALNPLLEALTKGDLNVKRQAALALKNLGPDAAAAVPELRKALHSPDKDLKHNAAVALIGFKQAGEPAVPDLVQLVVDRKEHPDVRKQAAVALSRIGFNPALEQSVPSLLGVVTEPSDVGVVRERALWPIRVYLIKAEEQKRDPVFKVLEKILVEPARKDIKMLRYDSAYLLGMFLEAKAPEKALDVLGEFLKDKEIKIYGGTTGGGQGAGEGTKDTKTKVADVGVGDGRIMAVDALSVVGPERVATRPDLVAQLRALNADPNTLPNLRKGLEKLMPQLEEVLKKK
jgi:HEAT repeat protein